MSDLDDMLDAYYSEGGEEASWIRTSLMAARFPVDMSDPWDMVEP